MTSPCARAAHIAVAVLAASVLAASGLGATAHAGADPFDCDATVHDPDGLLDRARLEATIDSTETLLDADVRIRVEGTLDGGLDRRIDQLVGSCDDWQDTDTDELADDMVVVIFSTVERENSIFYGADLGPVLESRWDAATDAMIPDLRTGDYTEAVLEGLDGLSHDPLGSSTPNDDTSDDTNDDETSGGVPGAVIFWVIVLVGIVVVGAIARQQGWSSGGGDDWDGDDSGSSGWTGGTRRRSSRGFGSFGSRSRSRSRSSGGGSRRAGGGTKKW